MRSVESTEQGAPERPLDPGLARAWALFRAGDTLQARRAFAAVDPAEVDEVDRATHLDPLERALGLDVAPWIVFLIGLGAWTWVFVDSALH